jgi:hypothetical protein
VDSVAERPVALWQQAHGRRMRLSGENSRRLLVAPVPIP